jgi:hypothetical protein
VRASHAVYDALFAASGRPRTAVHALAGAGSRLELRAAG